MDTNRHEQEREQITTRLRPAVAGLRRGRQMTRMIANDEARMSNDEGMTTPESRICVNLRIRPNSFCPSCPPCPLR
jgi:hypothetical protein